MRRNISKARAQRFPNYFILAKNAEKQKKLNRNKNYFETIFG